MKQFILSIYFRLLQSKLTFKLVIRLKELGIIKIVKDILRMGNNIQNNEHEKLQVQQFLEENSSRISAMLNFLADDKSREVWLAVMRALAEGSSVPDRLYSDNDQYFPKQIIHIDNDEVFVDCGAFVGDTIQHLLNFAKRQNANIGKIVAFEPDPENVKTLKRYFGKDKKVIIIDKGVSDKEDLLHFSPSGSNSSFMLNDDEAVQAKNVMIPVSSIDETAACHDATFIKMDIEGSELHALHGAYATIKRNYPKLAICIYHSLEDRLHIAEYIHTNFPKYKIYIRHHTAGSIETVLYCC